ncbi:MAG TPA: hypothetical protein VFZ00_31550 [Solirubrobacter sp.]|nr:hypothetical protein [Solirubrobacter sp.]
MSLDAMIQAGLMTAAQKRELEATQSFKGLFDSLHAGHDYSELVRARYCFERLAPYIRARQLIGSPAAGTSPGAPGRRAGSDRRARRMSTTRTRSSCGARSTRRP